MLNPQEITPLIYIIMQTLRIKGLAKVIQGQPNYKGVFSQSSFSARKSVCIVTSQILFLIAPWRGKNSD